MDLQSVHKKGRKKTEVDLSTMVYGKVPPQAIELEQAVLGAVLCEKDAFDRLSAILRPECFYVEAHQLIFKAMHGLLAKSMPIDILTVVEELKVREQLDAVGGFYYVTTLTNAVVSSANMEAHARIIFQKFMSRELIRIGGEMVGAGYDDGVDAFELGEDAEKKISDLMLLRSAKSYSRLDTVMNTLFDRVLMLQQRKEDVTGVPTGIHRLDIVTAGWQPTDFIVIAARPSIGKSAVAGNLALNAAKHHTKPTPVGIFSLEMGSVQWAQRILAADTMMDSWKISRGKLTDEEMEHLFQAGKAALSGIPIFIDDTAGISINEFKSKARRMVHKEKVGLIIVDYLQLMSGTGERNQQNREQEISNISRNMKALAKELNIPIIALSQLSRGVDRTAGRPKLSDLRESGAIEQDADVVIFLVPIDEQEALQDASLRDSIYLQIAKHRNGSLEDVEVKFVKSCQRIMSRSDWESVMYPMGMPDGKGKKLTPVKDLTTVQQSSFNGFINDKDDSSPAGDGVLDLPF